MKDYVHIFDSLYFLCSKQNQWNYNSYYNFIIFYFYFSLFLQWILFIMIVPDHKFYIFLKDFKYNFSSLGYIYLHPFNEPVRSIFFFMLTGYLFSFRWDSEILNPFTFNFNVILIRISFTVLTVNVLESV